ncbi:MAG: acyl carrier protein [Peptostreptococcaceae bacterium]|nr:acyl carrier protein [Peptostreptococcaceae bacterium]
MILEKIQDIISKQLGIDADSIQLTSNLTSDLDADSIEAVEIIMAIEDEFEIEIPDDKIESIVTVQDLVDFIDSLVG